jgi:endonuclease YncB( thermonuclease family)
MSSWAKYVPVYLAAVAIGGAYGTGVFDRLGGQPAEAAAITGERIQFSSCHMGGGYNCVVDGDTIWLQGQKIRIADIDTPETHDFRCPSEKVLGDRATKRLQQLLNNGSVTLQPIDRDEDRYGRKLRIVMVDGASVGDTLVGEGLARWYGSGRQPWC